jgi:hypothetical protein
MKKHDQIKEWFKDLPQEKAPQEFSNKVMHQVMSEWSLNPYKYQPIISKKAWWTIGFMAIIITGILFSIYSSLPNTGSQKTFFGINLTNIFSFAGGLFEKLNNISPAVGISALAIVALWFFDQLFTRIARR